MKLLLSLCVVLAVLWSAVQGNGHSGRQPHPRPSGHDRSHGHGRGHHHGKGHWREHGQEHEGHHFNGSLKIYRENIDFAFRLYKHISALPDSQSKNVFFSPLSVSVALAALSVGARGKTHQELFEGLGFNGTDVTAEEVNEAFQHIFQDLNKKTDVDLSLGSAAFISDKAKVNDEFLKSIKRYYQADSFQTDFQDTDGAKNQINDYVKNKTKGKIPELIDSMEQGVFMYLLSYIYFKGEWEIPFDPDSTQEDTFHIDDKTTVPVQMMAEQNFFHVYHDKEISTHVLQMHYNESVSMMLVLPEKGLKELEKVACKDHLRKWIRSVEKKKYKVFVPKLSIKTKYQLKEILIEMGITDIFKATADLKGIADEQLVVSKVAHMATLDVDEAGTEAAAATAVEIMLTSALMPHPTPVLKFDRPFMVFVVNRETRSILFMGKIVNPAEK
ncbi:alpha-1-antitrypsin-like isoform X2 [Megalops cyprinoides]|nr:alpha-1-antitrypsin-like isoform X2 [Megalops cyprinoides]XP_036383080.1 alpha-1-antitrypsin-like isoform X2 [Megalops cyprinoides]